MKNKLLVTTALVGMVASGAALAETKLSGNMVLGYKAITISWNKERLVSTVPV